MRMELIMVTHAIPLRSQSTPTNGITQTATHCDEDAMLKAVSTPRLVSSSDDTVQTGPTYHSVPMPTVAKRPTRLDG